MCRSLWGRTVHILPNYFPTIHLFYQSYLPLLIGSIISRRNRELFRWFGMARIIKSFQLILTPAFNTKILNENSLYRFHIPEIDLNTRFLSIHEHISTRRFCAHQQSKTKYSEAPQMRPMEVGFVEGWTEYSACCWNLHLLHLLLHYIAEVGGWN